MILHTPHVQVCEPPRGAHFVDLVGNDRKPTQQPIQQWVWPAGDGEFGFNDFVDFSAGLGGALLPGFGDDLRDMMGSGSVDMDIDAYSAVGGLRLPQAYGADVAAAGGSAQTDAIQHEKR